MTTELPALSRASCAINFEEETGFSHRSLFLLLGILGISLSYYDYNLFIIHPNFNKWRISLAVHRTTVEKVFSNKISYKFHPYMPRNILYLAFPLLLLLLHCSLSIGFTRFSIPCHGRFLLLFLFIHTQRLVARSASARCYLHS